MNRRSILSSLSSMFVAALAWPKQADATSEPKKFPTYYIKVYNGIYVSAGRTANRTAAAGELVPGQSTVHVKAYGATSFTTLSPGSSCQFSKEASNSKAVKSTFIAANGDATSTLALSQEKNAGQILYLLVNASGSAAPTITAAPPGVTF